MANYKVPRSVEVVDALPLNASGKVLKYELRDRASRFPRLSDAPGAILRAGFDDRGGRPMARADEGPVDHVVVGAGAAGCVVAARLSEDTDRRVAAARGGRHRKVALAADLVFQIQFLLGELVLEGSDLAIGEGVVDGNGHLVRHLGQERHLLRGEGLHTPSTEAQHAQAALAAAQGQEAVGLETLPRDQTADLGGVGAVDHHGLPRLSAFPGEGALDQNRRSSWMPPWLSGKSRA